MRVKVLVASVALVFLSTSAGAYTVPNNDFELPDLAYGTYWYGSPSYWIAFEWHTGQWSALGNGGVFHEAWVDVQYNRVVPADVDGEQWATIPIGRKLLSDPAGNNDWSVGNCTVEADADVVIDFDYGKKRNWTASTELKVVIDAYSSTYGWMFLDEYILSIPWANDSPERAEHAQVVLNTNTSIHGSQWIGAALHVGFIAQGAGSYNFAETLIDDVVITPEPATVALMTLGTVGTVLLRRRK